MALCGEFVIVSDSGNHRLSVFAEADGAWIGHILSHDPPFDDPSGVRACSPRPNPRLTTVVLVLLPPPC